MKMARNDSNEKLYLYGKRSIEERLKAAPESVRRVILEHGGARVQDIAGLARSRKVPVELMPGTQFRALTRGIHSQGVAAEVEEFVYADLDDVLDSGERPTLILLDRINDPQNLGSILRTCACLGSFCVVLPKHESVDVTETVLKVACGAENHVPVCLVSSLSVAVDKARRSGYWIGATVVEGGTDPRSGTPMNFPLALIIGSEGEGVRSGLLKDADYRFTLPMRGAALSLNAAVSTGIFCYEAASQRAEYEKKS